MSIAIPEAEREAQLELDRHAFGQKLHPQEPSHPAYASLHALLVDAGQVATPAERVDWLEAVGHWVLDGPNPPADPLVQEDERTRRLRLLVHALETFPEQRVAFSGTVRALLLESSGLHLFCATGLPAEHGFLYEAASRFVGKFLPEPRDVQDLSALFARIFSHQRHARWLSSVDTALLGAFTLCLEDPTVPVSPFVPLKDSMLDALALVSQRVSSLGLADDVRSRSPEVPLRYSPFLSLSRTYGSLQHELRGAPTGELENLAQACRMAIKSCRRFVRAVFRHLDQRGVSVDLVYRTEMIAKGLDRLETMTQLVVPENPEAAPRDRLRSAVSFFAGVVEDGHREKSVLALLRSNSRHLARKIIERTGVSGEHYITNSRAEYFKMLASAGGGGVLTAFTAALKYVIVPMQLPRFFEGLFLSVDYAGSFLLMQLVGFTLATKQPSMTAASLAAALNEKRGPDGAERSPHSLVDLIARIVRSQLAAAAGNVGLVIPAAYLFDLAYRKTHGHPFLDPATAHHTLESLHPLHDGLLPLAALTGVFLWLSSVAGGWLENWTVYRRLPEAIAETRWLRRLLGPERVDRLTQRLFGSIASTGGSITLGVLLGMAPAVGGFFGVSLQGKHVTLSTGSLTLAACALGWTDSKTMGLSSAVLGIGCILLLNFGVSFALALIVALRAREVSSGEQLRLGRALLARFVFRPWDFLVPPQESAKSLPKLAHPDMDLED